VSRLLASLAAPPSGRERAIWFDAADYGRAKLLAGAAVPWDFPAELASFVAKLQAMFGSDAILADVGDVFARRAAGDAQLRAAMAARTRPGYALRTLLADEQARSVATEAIRALAATAGGSALIHPEAYRSVLNVADHYGWPVLIRADAAAAWPHGSIPGVTAWLGPAAADVISGRWGVVAGAGFWDGDDPAPDAELVLVPVPAQADPEAVMKRGRALS
jgi:hypothetical protein